MAACAVPSGKSASNDDDGHLYPITVLYDEFNSISAKIRLNAVKKLSTTALALGAEKTRLKLIPFITEKISVEEDGEILMMLAKELGNFINYVGGPDFGHILLIPLKELARDEETIVRDMAVESLRKIGGLLSLEDLESYFVNLIFTMVSANWYTLRCSVCSLFSVLFPHVSPMTKAELCNYYCSLCADELPVVRRAAAINLKELALVFDMVNLRKHLIQWFATVSVDDQETVRSEAIDACVNIFTRLERREVTSVILPFLNNFSVDDSWKVRFKFAYLFVKLQKIVGPELFFSKLAPIFLLMWNDTNVDVKSAVTSKAYEFCCNLHSEDSCVSSSDSNAKNTPTNIDVFIMNSILPKIYELATDPNGKVRMALASVIMKFSFLLGKERTLEHLIPLILNLLRDDNPEVRLNIIIHLDCVNEVIGIEQLSENLLPAVFEHSNDSKWRIRLAIVEYMPLLACQLSAELFTDQHLSLCVSWLTNHVYAIREAGTFVLKKLVEIFGTEWAQEFVIPKVIPIAEDPKYLYRMSFLFCINELADVFDPEIIAKSILPTVLSMVSDRVANVRLNVAKTLKKIGYALSADDKSQIKPILDKLSSDKDVDVKYFAAEAISSILWN